MKAEKSLQAFSFALVRLILIAHAAVHAGFIFGRKNAHSLSLACTEEGPQAGPG